MTTTPASRWRAAARPYVAVLASRARSQRSYRANFALDLVSSALVALVELAEVLVLYRSVSSLGGLSLAQVVLVFGIADSCFSAADMVVGHVDDLPPLLRAGKLDVFFLRPQPLLAQLVTSDISLRRLTRIAVGVGALVVGLHVAHVDLAWRSAALLGLTLVASTATFAALYVTAAGLQFFLVSGAEATNAMVYGGRYAATQPASVWSRPLVAVFGFAVPMASTAYLPVVTLLGLPAPHGVPSWAGWCAPVTAAWAWLLAAVSWRAGVRHYSGGGG